MGHRHAVVETVLAVARTSYEQHIQYPAAALAYYGFVSLVPLLVILVAVGGVQVTRPIRTAAFRFLTPEAQRLVVEALTNSSGKVGAILFATLVLVWSGANITAGFQTVVKRVERPSDRSFPGKMRDAVGILGPLGLGLGAVVLTNLIYASDVVGVICEAADEVG